MFKKLTLILLVASMMIGSGLLFGCATTTSSDSDPAPAPTGTTTIEVGSGGSATLTAGSTSGQVSVVVVSQTASDPVGSPVTSTDNLNIQNITVQVWTTTTTTQSASVDTITYQGGTAGSAISYALTLDRSGSMGSDDIVSMEAAAKDFIGNAGASDQGAVINFESDVKVDQTLTTDKNLLKYAVTNETTSGGMTALYDSIAVAVTTVEAGTNSRKAVIAMTDGGDTASSQYTLTSCISVAATANIPVYTVGLGSGLSSTVLQQIATDTGGLFYAAPTAADLENLYDKISSVLSSSWTVNITSPVTFTTSTTYYVLVTVTYDNGITGSTLFTVTL